MGQSLLDLCYQSARIKQGSVTDLTRFPAEAGFSFHRESLEELSSASWSDDLYWCKFKLGHDNSCNSLRQYMASNLRSFLR